MSTGQDVTSTAPSGRRARYARILVGRATGDGRGSSCGGRRTWRGRGVSRQRHAIGRHGQRQGVNGVGRPRAPACVCVGGWACSVVYCMAGLSSCRPYLQKHPCRAWSEVRYRRRHLSHTPAAVVFHQKTRNIVRARLHAALTIAPFQRCYSGRRTWCWRPGLRYSHAWSHAPYLRYHIISRCRCPLFFAAAEPHRSRLVVSTDAAGTLLVPEVNSFVLAETTAPRSANIT